MELDNHAKQAVRELGNAINTAIGESIRVAEAIKSLREIGYEPNLLLKLEIALSEIGFNDFPEKIDLDLTDEDVKTFQKMGIRLDAE